MMQKAPISIILLQDPNQLEISAELRDFMLSWKFPNLHVMLNDYSAAQLLKLKGFSYHCLVELYGLLKENGCERMLRERS